MADTTQVGIKASCPLMTFAKNFSAMKVTSPMVNSKTGEVFRSCAFIDAAGAVTLVGFSSKLGELTPAQISAQKDELQVVELNSGNFKLCKSGADSWETVDLGF